MKIRSMFYFVFICLLSLAISRCDDSDWTDAPAGPIGPGQWKIYLYESGIKREIYVYVPSIYDSSEDVPLLLVFHGYMDTALNQMAADDFPEIAERENFIVAYPQGYGTAGFLSWNAGKACCGAAVDKNLDDVTLARDIVSDLAGRCSIDLRRVYAHGHSNGAGLAHRLGREASDVFAAITPKSMPVLVPDELPAYPVPMLEFHGSMDTTINYYGGTIPFESASYISVNKSFSNWANADGCTGTPVTTYYSSSYCKRYSSCEDGSLVELCTLYLGNHNDLYGRKDIDVSEMSWEFMSQFTR